MASSAFPTGDASDRALPEDAKAAPDSEQAPDEGLLEQVLRETLQAADAGGAIDPVEMDALVEVARRRRGRPLELEPVAVELVEAILRTRFGALSAKEGLFHSMARQIAETLLEAPETHERLDAFWRRLREAAR